MPPAACAVDVAVASQLLPYGMRSSWYDGECPDFGGSLVTNGADYERFLAGTLTYNVLSRQIVDASERVRSSERGRFEGAFREGG
eukprot:6803917-Prymnesium_polylepis.2